MCTTFEGAVEEIRNLSRLPTDTELLELYGLYKQGTLGDNRTNKPWLWEIQSCAKWHAWEAEFGKAELQAQQDYVQLVNRLIQKYQD